MTHIESVTFNNSLGDIDWSRKGFSLQIKSALLKGCMHQSNIFDLKYDLSSECIYKCILRNKWTFVELSWTEMWTYLKSLHFGLMGWKT